MAHFSRLGIMATLALYAGVAHANTITVNGYTVLGVNEHVSYTGRINNEYAGAGQITLLTTQGSLSSWCTDLFDNLATGIFTQQTLATDQNATGAVLTPTQISEIGGLVNAGNSMNLTAQASAAFQNAIWSVEYGSQFSFVSDDSTVAGLTKTYVNDIMTGVFALSGPVTQYVVAGNQGQATSAMLVDEPTSVALLVAGLIGVGWLRHRRLANGNSQRKSQQR